MGGKLLWALLLACGVATGVASGAELEAEEIELKVALQERQAEMEVLLERWVNTNTGTWNADGLQEFADELEQSFEALGFEVVQETSGELDYPGRNSASTGPLVIGRRASRREPAPRIVVGGHYDTVFEADSPFQEFRRDPQRPDLAFGPGVADMKGGLVVLLYALAALEESGDLDRASWTLFLNADEEIGSLASRERIEEEARKGDAGFVFESASPEGMMVRSRRGLGQFYLAVRGVSAHSGSSHEQGRSAVTALAHKVLEIEALTDYPAGVTLNAGVFHGGTKRNIVPDFAEAWVDLRYDRPEQGEAIRDRLREIADYPHVADTQARLWSRLHRPPKVGTERTSELLELHASIAKALGFPSPPPIHAGGGTDGSLMAAVGLSVLDSMGVRGGAAHTEREFIVLSSLSERAALAAILLRRVARQPPAEGATARRTRER